jgi:hypothetical protein
MAEAEGNHYEIELSFNNKAEKFRIPVNPETIEIRESGNGKTYDIIGKGGSTEETRAGEINVIKNPKLREVSFSSIFPAQHYPFVVSSNLLQPMEYVAFIRKWMATKRPIRFVYAGAYAQYSMQASDNKILDISMPASIEKFEWREVAGSPGDIEYNLSLKEYVFYSARRVTVSTNTAGETVLIQQPPDRPDERIRPETYKLQAGDTLIHVAMKFYNGDSTRWSDIQKYNGLTDAQLKSLPIGLDIRLPPV